MSTFDRALFRLHSQLTANGATLAAGALKANTQSQTSEPFLAKIARESVLRGAISESCVEWITNGRLPLMSSADALLFYDRIFYGFAFGELLAKSGFSWPGSEADLLRWLLIDSWERISCLLWKWDLENP
jgi:hypothetical protein